jgi:hypothetical protein
MGFVCLCWPEKIPFQRSPFISQQIPFKNCVTLFLLSLVFTDPGDFVRFEIKYTPFFFYINTFFSFNSILG